MVHCWNWAMDNMPGFARRWKSRQAGNDVLRSWRYDWDWTKTEWVQKLQRAGITPNAFIDALTVSMGSEAVYRSRYRGYLKDGYSVEDARERALSDAEIAFNLSQQSSELPYLSLMQNERSYMTTALTMFRNSPFSYTRQVVESMRELGNMVAHRAEQIEFETKKGMREGGFSEDVARRNAERKYRRNWARNFVKASTFAYVLPTLWAYGLKGVWYGIFGDDDDQKREDIEDSLKRGRLGAFEGLTGGGTVPDLVHGWWTCEGRALEEETSPAVGLVKDFANYVTEGKTERAANEVVNTMIALGCGMNPQVIEDVVVATQDYMGADVKSSREFAILVMRAMSCPQSQIDRVYFDEIGMTAAEAQGVSIDALAERYAEYKVRRAHFVSNSKLTGDKRDAAKAPYLKKVIDLAKEDLSERTYSPEVAALDAQYKKELADLKALRATRGVIGDEAYKAAVEKYWADHGGKGRHKLVQKYHSEIKGLTEAFMSAGSQAERDSIVKKMEAARELLLDACASE
jgi:hypothetical protein